jgi:hypothetical protein
VARRWQLDDRAGGCLDDPAPGSAFNGATVEWMTPLAYRAGVGQQHFVRFTEIWEEAAGAKVVRT